VLQKSAEFLNEMLERILEQREDQDIVFTVEELETQNEEMKGLKEKQKKQERCANVTEGVLLLLVAVSAYTYVYWDYNKTGNFFFLPMFLLLNATMLIAVVVMRFAIQKMPNLLPNENLVIIHVLLFTAVTVIWIFDRVFLTDLLKTQSAYSTNPTNESFLNYLYASASYLKVNVALITVDTLLNLFMLYMLHQLSIFEGFVYDPITG